MIDDDDDDDDDDDAKLDAFVWVYTVTELVIFYEEFSI